MDFEIDWLTFGWVALGVLILFVVSTHKPKKKVEEVKEVEETQTAAPYKVEATVAQESAPAVEPAKEVISETSKPARKPRAKPPAAAVVAPAKKAPAKPAAKKAPAKKATAKTKKTAVK
jgi:DNA-binding protein HU-beta